MGHLGFAALNIEFSGRSGLLEAIIESCVWEYGSVIKDMGVDCMYLCLYLSH